MNPLKVAVIGIGNLGRHHARIYSTLKNVELVGVCDINKGRAKKFARLYHTTPHTDYRQLIGRVDAASIVVPTNLHFQIAREFLENNAHLLIEKPITNDLACAEHLVGLAKKHNLILQVGHIERFNQAVKAIEPLCQNPQFVECHRMCPFKKRTLDSGVVLDLMIHDIDIILGLIKSPIASIEAVGIPVLTDFEDIANARIKFENGAVVNISASRLSRNELRKIRIFQKDAYISLDYVKQSVAIYRKVKNRIAKSSIRVKAREPLLQELESFVNCILNEQRPLVTGEDAVSALRIALEITEKIEHAKDALHNSR